MFMVFFTGLWLLFFEPASAMPDLGSLGQGIFVVHELTAKTFDKSLGILLTGKSNETGGHIRDHTGVKNVPGLVRGQLFVGEQTRGCGVIKPVAQVELQDEAALDTAGMIEGAPLGGNLVAGVGIFGEVHPTHGTAAWFCGLHLERQQQDQ